jgi:subtilisin family serine protease
VTRTLIAFLAAALLAPSSALAGDWAVGAHPGGLAVLRAQLPHAQTLVPGRALLVQGARPRVHGAAYVVDLNREHRRLSFDNTEPDASQQWYLPEDDAWNHWAAAPTDLTPVKVAVIDSGIDAGHPEFAGRVLAGISFVGSSWRTDDCGHGTFVAGEIAANPVNGIGIAGIAFNAELLVAKVVQSDCNVSTTGEVRAITWAVNHGAKVINLSIGGNRDPEDPQIDSFSPAEEAAVEYAWSKGVLVVAAVGNGPQAPRTPWPFADYPAALPHVLGVAAVTESGNVPAYSNRDKQFVDIAAPGGPIFSTIPRALVDASMPGCSGPNSAYANCGPSEFKDGIGTSFAAPQVTAAAALVLGVHPELSSSQLEWVLERSATDATAATGCEACPVGRDSLTGWGTLNVAAAVDLAGRTGELPPPDALEANDDAGRAAHPLGTLPRTVVATLDYWDDPVDVYSIRLDKGDRLFARLGLGSPVPNSLLLWRPGTTTVSGSPTEIQDDRAARSIAVAGQQRLSYLVPATGIYYLEVTTTAKSRAADRYDLSVARRKPGSVG